MPFNVAAENGGSGELRFQWQISSSASGPFTDISGANSFSYTPEINTTNNTSSPVVRYYRVVVNNSGNTCAADTSAIRTVTVTPGVITEAGPDLTVCAGSSVNLTGASLTFLGNTFTGTWSIQGGGVGSITNQNSVTGAAYNAPANAPNGTVVTLVLTSGDPTGNCGPIVDTRTVTINNLSVSAVSNLSTVCQGPNASFNLTGTLNGTWTNPSVFWSSTGGTFSNPNGLGTTFTPNSNATGNILVTLTATDANCGVKTTTLTVTVNTTPVVTASAPDAACSGSTIALTGSVSGSATTGTWTSSGTGTFDPGTTTSTSLNPIYTPSIADIAAGTVTFTLTSADPEGPCGSGAASVSVDILPAPAISLTAMNDGVCAFSTNEITFETTGGQGVFTTTASPSSALVSSNGTTATLDVEAVCAGNYDITFTVTTPAGCSVSQTVSVTVDNCGIDQLGTLKYFNPAGVTGTVTTTGVANATVDLYEGTTMRDTDMSSSTGSYNVKWTSGDNFVIRATKNRTWTGGAMTGITPEDASAVLRHAGGLAAFQLQSPLKRIAADVNINGANNKGIINSADASLILQALTGSPIAQEVFAKRTWVFVPEFQTATMTVANWNTFRDTLFVTDPCALTDGDFIGIKLGDIVVLTTDNATNPGAAFTSNVGADLGWMVTDKVLMEGAEVTAEFRAMGIESLMAYQFALGYDTETLEFVSLEAIDGAAIAPVFGTTQQGVIRTAFASGVGLDVTSDTPVFRVRFRVKQGGGMLSQALQIDDTAMDARVSTFNDYRMGDVNLWFTTLTDTEVLTKGGLSLYQNRPNPFNEKTMIGYIVPESCEVRMRIYDASGRLITEQKAWSNAGYNEMEFRFDNYSGAGVLYYELDTPMGSLTRKMVINRAK